MQNEKPTATVTMLLAREAKALLKTLNPRNDYERDDAYRDDIYFQSGVDNMQRVSARTNHSAVIVDFPVGHRNLPLK